MVVACAAALLAFTGAAFTNGSSVPATKLGSSVQATGANDVKPSQCSGLTLTVVVDAAGTYTAPNGVNGLLLGSSGIDRITGRNGNEWCIGGPGTDTFSNCETQIQ